MTIKPIQILTPNLIIHKNANINHTTQDDNILIDINFATAITADTLIIKDLSAQSVDISTIVDAIETQIIRHHCQGKQAVIITLPSSITAMQIRLTLIAPTTQNIPHIYICKSLLTLSNVLSALMRDDFKKEGHYYMSDGRLITWHEFVKFGCRLQLKNVTKQTRDNIQNLFSDYTFLTFILYGDYDAAACYELAPAATVSEQLSRQSALYELEYKLLER